MHSGTDHSDCSPFHLVVVDDDPSERVEIHRLLRAGSVKNYEVAEVSTGAAAVELILNVEQPRPNCVLLSDALPDMIATEVLAAILTSTGIPPCPVVVFIRTDGPDIGRDVLRGGAQDYIEKEWITPRGLTRSIENATERWALTKQLIERNNESVASEKQFRDPFKGAAHDISDRKLAEERLFEAESRLLALMNALPVGVSFSDDRSCERITGNLAVLAQFAVKPADNLSATAIDPAAPGRQIQFFSGGRRVDHSELPLQRAVAEDRTIPPMDLEILMPDGRRWYAESSGAPIHDDRGEVVAGVAVTVDVTSRLEAENALRQCDERRRLTLEAGSMGTYEVDLVTGEGSWNSVEYELLGLQAGEVSACSDAFFRCVHPDDIARLRQEWDEAIQTGTLDTEFRVVSADGNARWLAGKGAFLHAGDSVDGQSEMKPTRFLGVNYDITKMKDAERRIKKLNAELEDRVTQRTSQLESANKELEAFTYSVSHDMRAPVRAIRGFLRILQEEHLKNVSPDAADCLDEVARNAKYMGRLIDDLLNFSRLGRLALRMENFSPEVIVQQCVGEQNIGLTAEIRLLHLWPCCADVFLLKQVWMNLLENAVKYSRLSTPPVIEIGSARSEREVFYFVKDNGVGFDMRYVDKLYGVFQRLHRQEDYEGTGVGLAIVQRIIHRHGGRVWAESSPGVGATFYFSLLREEAAT